MPDPTRLRDTLLAHTASSIGRAYLQQLVSQLARLTGAQQAFVTQRAIGSKQHLQILVASSAEPSGCYPFEGTPCAQVYDKAAPLLIAQDLNQLFAAEIGTPWQSFIAWPLLAGQNGCIGHLALLSQQVHAFSPALLEAVQPFALRASAELQRLQQEDKQAQQQHWQLMHSDILRQNAQGQPLTTLLTRVIGHIEHTFPEWQCAVLMLDEHGLLQPLIAPSLPPACQQQLAGLAPGPHNACCGAAIWHGQRVIAEDLQQDAHWADYRALAARFGLGSCWSQPLIDSKGKTHGTFAIYQHDPASPSAQAISILEDTARLLALLLENHDIHRMLHSRTQWYRALLQNAADALAIIDLDGHFLEASDSLCRLLDVSAQALATLRLWDIDLSLDEKSAREHLNAITPQPSTFESRVLLRNGKQLELELSVRRLTLDGKDVIWGSARDISQRKALQLALQIQASTDALTGLFNRQTLLQRLDVLLQLAKVHCAPLSVLMLDLDHFKNINDVYGHQAGDQVLAELGATLNEVLRESDVAGRIGGEEFCLLLPGLPLSSALDVAERIVEDVSGLRIHSDRHILAITCSIGVACLSPHDDSRTLLARADAALYQAKAAGRHCALCLPTPP